jgi:hypothetical protein
LLLATLQVCATNVIGFALIYWEPDRGGPVSPARRSRRDLPAADWRISQDENNDAVTEVAAGSSGRSGWMPVFVDYLYLSITNSSAFSPTASMPLSRRAKMLMGVQATAALLIIARAVGAIQRPPGPTLHRRAAGPRLGGSLGGATPTFPAGLRTDAAATPPSSSRPSAVSSISFSALSGLLLPPSEITFCAVHVAG